MAVALPGAIEVQEFPCGVRYLLPRRPLGWGWHSEGVPLLMFGATAALLFAGLAAFQVAEAVKAGPVGVLGLLWALKFLPIALAYVAFLLFGLWQLWSRLEIDAAGKRLRVVERLGPLRWSRSRRLRDVAALSIIGHRAGAVPANDQRFPTTAAFEAERVGPGRRGLLLGVPGLLYRRLCLLWLPVLADPTADLALLVARCAGGRSLMLAGGYPRAWLTALAGDLARRSADGLAAPPPARAGLVLGESFIEDFDQPRVTDRPAGSRAVLERHPDGLLVTLPPPGIGADRTVALFVAAGGASVLIWLAFSAAVVACAVFGNQPLVAVVLVGTVAMGGAWGALLWKGLDLGRCQARVAVVGEDLLVWRAGLGRPRRYEWRRDDIAALRADRAIDGWMALLVYPRRGKRVALLGGRKAAELHWLATLLRDALRVPATPAGH